MVSCSFGSDAGVDVSRGPLCPDSPSLYEMSSVSLRKKGENGRKLVFVIIPDFPAQGSNADGMYFIESGVVDVHVIGSDGKTEKLVSILMQQLFSKIITIHNSSI